MKNNNLSIYMVLFFFLNFLSCGKDSDVVDDQDQLLTENNSETINNDSNNTSSSNNNGVESDHLITSPSQSKASSLLMTSSEYSQWINDDQFRDGFFRNNLFKDIYKRFTDKYDFIFLVLNEENIPQNINYYGMLIDVSNNVSGIGLSQYDYSSDYGSSGKLKAVMQLTGLSFLQNGPALHELMHNWGNYSLPSENVDDAGSNLNSYSYYGHWGFTGGSTLGQLGGFKQSTLQDLGSNQYSVSAFGPFANGGNSIPFNEFELYLMGMIPLSSVNAFDLFNKITSLEITDAKYTFSANSRITYTQDILENLLGPRLPSYTASQKEFNLLVIVITDSPLNDEQWNTINTVAEWFSFEGPDDSYLYNFWEATNGIGSIVIGD